MHPILWLPLTNIANPSGDTIDTMKKNKGIAPIYKSDIAFSNVGLFDGCYGKNIKLNNSASYITAKIGHKYGDTLWGKFSITFFVYLDNNSFAEGEFLRMSGGGNTTTIGTSGGQFVVNGNNVGAYTLGKWTAIAFTCYSNRTNLYIDGQLTAQPTSYVYSTSCEITLTLQGYSHPVSIFNLKVYNTEIAKRTVLNDYNCMLMHYKFDGSSSDDPTYDTEYDMSGFENDMKFPAPVTMTSTSSPTRQLSVLSSNANININMTSPQWCLVAWFYDTIPPTIMVDDKEIKINAYSIAFTPDDGTGSELANLNQIAPVDNWFLGYINKKPDGTLEVWMSSSTMIYKQHVSSANTIVIKNPVAISDLRIFMNKPSDSELHYLCDRNMTIDENGTVYATELQEVTGMTSFAVGSRGQILSPAFESVAYSNEKGVMDYDYIHNKLCIRDFEEI